MRNYGNGVLRFDGKEYETHEVETLKEIIDITALERPKKPAYMYKTSHREEFKTITYGTFRVMMDALGTAMIHKGLKGANIAVIGDNSYRWALSYFATVCGVGVIVPIDKNLKPEEIENLLTRAEVQMIFTDAKPLAKIKPMLESVESLKYITVMQEAAFSDEDERVLSQDDLIDEGLELLKMHDHSYLDANVNPDDLCTILFTSGTTGLAKGVMLSHRNFAKNIENVSKFFQIPKKRNRVLSILPMHHAYEMTCTVMTAFYQGATVVFCEGLKYLQSNFIEAKCSVVLGVPLIFESIHKKIYKQAEKSGEAEKLQKGLEFSRKWGIQDSKWMTKRLFKSIQSVFGKNLYCLVAGGAAINPDVIIDFKTMGLPIIQGYGMTECAPLIALNPDRYSTDSAAGLPIPGTEIAIFEEDEHGIGEIIVKSPSVMMGYYKDPETTAETIVDGWLHTGDYGYIDEDGWVYITGRKKNVIVTKGGKNIFPEEIEYYLNLNDEITESIVYGREDLSDDDVVCTAIIFPNFEYLKEQGITEDVDVYDRIKAMVALANDKVPAYKRVRRIEIRDKEFVKTTTLKIKRFDKENFEYKFDGTKFEGNRRF